MDREWATLRHRYRLEKGEDELPKRAKGDLIKVKLAARLREETVMTVSWIAARLKMGTSGYVNNRLYRWRKGVLK